MTLFGIFLKLWNQFNLVQFEYDHAKRLGVKCISPISDRDWGDRVCYFTDEDGHIIAFAEKGTSQND